MASKKGEWEKYGRTVLSSVFVGFLELVLGVYQYLSGYLPLTGLLGEISIEFRRVGALRRQPWEKMDLEENHIVTPVFKRFRSQQRFMALRSVLGLVDFSSLRVLEA